MFTHSAEPLDEATIACIDSALDQLYVMGAEIEHVYGFHPTTFLPNGARGATRLRGNNAQ